MLTLRDFIGDYRLLTPLAQTMLAAWNGVAKPLPTWALQPGPSVDAWNRVAEAAKEYIETEQASDARWAARTEEN